MRNEFLKTTILPGSSPGITALLAIALLGGMVAQQAQAAITLERTRMVFDGDQKSVSMSLHNRDLQLPYLVQGWIEDEQGNKIRSPFTMLPPLQRIEPDSPSQIRIQGLPAARLLRQDRETLYYVNLREIPPKNTRQNTLQITLQTSIKLFYRPAAIAMNNNTASPYKKMTLTRQGDNYVVNNPTPYYVTIVGVGSKEDSPGGENFEAVMVPPYGSQPLMVSAANLGASPVLTYVNDAGGQPALSFSCSGSTCTVAP